MAILIGLLTVIMVLDCLFLILLVLMQLPKKEAGAGVAFGGGATDALFGAGSGNLLTKATKYAAISFFVLTILLSILQSQYAHRPGSEFRRLLQKQSQQAPAVTAPASQSAAPAAAPAMVSGTNSTGLLPLGPATTNSAPPQ